MAVWVTIGHSRRYLQYPRNMPPYPFAEWVTEQLRLTMFRLQAAADLPLERWWEAVVDSPATESIANARTGMRTLAGAFGAGKLILKLEPDRIDWLLTPPDPDPSAVLTADLPSIGPITENLELFSNIARRWLARNDIPEPIRIAFGTVIRHAEPDRRSAYMRLPEYLPLQIDPDSTDFFMQINTPTDSRTGVPGLRINQFSKWAIMGLARILLRPEAGRMTAAATEYMVHAFRLELDMNTSAEFRGPLPGAQLGQIYDELVGLGRHIATEGLRHEVPVNNRNG